MDSVNSFVEFFYNLVPGVVFILIFRLIVPIALPSGDNSLIATVIVLGLFLGFTFQGVTRISRKYFLFREQIFEEIKCKDQKTYMKAKRILIKKNLIEDNDSEREETPKQIMNYFYLMDNYLRGKMQSVIIDHFAAKAAFWSNIFWGSLIITIISFSRIISDYNMRQFSAEPTLPIIAVLSFIVVFLSYFMSKEYWSSQYNVVMKTFIMVAALDLKIKID